MAISTYHDLTVWQKAMALATACYTVSDRLPARERFGLRSQITRAAVSIPSNIAEGNGRGHRREYLHFVYIARGSLFELITCLEIAVRCEYLREEDLIETRELMDHVGRMLTRLSHSLRESR